MRYDLNLLRVFLALLEERNVTRAAEKTGMTQPAMSNALRRLRELFNDPLFVRERYGMRPTEKALAMEPVINTALSELDRTVLAHQSFDPATEQHTFTLATNDYMEYVLLPRLLGVLEARAPGIRLRTLPYGGDPVDSGLISGETDLVIGRVADPPDSLVVRELATDGLACVVRADHPLVGERMTRSLYERLNHINVVPPNRLKVGLFSALESHGLRRRVVATVPHFLAVPDLLAATDCCSTLPGLMCRKLAADPRLKVLEPPVDLGRFPIHLAWHVRYRNDPAHQWVRDRVVEAAEQLCREQ